MATFEVHDGLGGVQYVQVGRDNPAMFGTDPRCDLVLADPAALPFHGRLRWRRGKFKVEATPEAGSLEVNGRKVIAVGLKRGDEVRVGRSRIYLLNPDDAPVAEAKTEVRPMPKTASARPSEVPPPPLPRRRRLELEEVIPPSVEIPEVDLDRLKRSIRASERRAKVETGEPPSRWSRLARFFSPRGRAPGEESYARSPLILALVAALVGLVAAGFALAGIIARTAADRQFMQAEESYRDGDDLNAVRLFDAFAASKPKDARAGKARILGALANVRQYTAGGAPAWPQALDAARSMRAKLAGLPEYRDASADLAELVLKSAEGMADRARSTADADALAQAEAAAGLHRQVAGEPGANLQARSKLPAKLDAARVAVRRARDRSDALASMDAALAAGSPSGVYAARDRVVSLYGDMGTDAAIVDRLTRANALIRKAVALDSTTRPAETAPRAEPLGPPTSLVLRTPPFAPATSAGPVVYALADGFAYGLDGATGAPLWHRPVGLASPFPPRPIGVNAPSALVFDARHGELLHLDAHTGVVLWRAPTDGPLADPPRVVGNQIVAATPAGKLLFLDLPTGLRSGTLDLGLPLAKSPAADESGDLLYVLAERSNLFIVRRDPPTCLAVEYLGHDAGTVAAAPARLGRFLIVAENHALDAGRWGVHLLDEAGLSPRRVQTIAVPGWTWAPPTAAGSVVWSASDRGGVEAYGVGDYDQPQPLKLIARLAAEAKPSGPAYALARGDAQAWVASGRTARLDLNATGPSLAAAWTLVAAGPAVAPIQVAGNLFISTHQSTEGPGVALWGIDPAGGEVRWRTILGAPWSVAPTIDGDGLLGYGPEGRPLRIDASALARGGFVEAALPRPGAPRLGGEPWRRVDLGGKSVLIAEQGSSLAIPEGGSLRFVALPAMTSAWPLPWREDLLIAGVDGRVYLVDPATGASRAEPFVPPFDRARPSRWRSMARVDGDAVALADESGRLRLLRRSPDGLRLVADGPAVDLGAPIRRDPASTGPSLVVATADGKVRILAARDLSPAGTIDLPASLRGGPWVDSGNAFLLDAAGTLTTLGTGGRRLWAADIGLASIVGAPRIDGDRVVLMDAEGKLQSRSMADGARVDLVELGISPAGGMVPIAGGWTVPTGRASLQRLGASTTNPP